VTEQWSNGEEKQIYKANLFKANHWREWRASFMQLAIPNGASLTPDLLPLRHCNPDLLHSATLQP